MANLINCWAGSFNASAGDHVNCGRDPAFNFYPTLNEFTLAVWVKSAEITQQIALARGNSTVQYGLGITDKSVDTYIGGQQFSDDADFLGVGIVNDDEWHLLVAVVRTSPQQVSVFMDGQLLAQHNYTGTSLAATDLLIGGRRATGNTGTALSWNGQLDEVAVWNVALSNDAVQDLYNAGTGVMYNEDAGFYLQKSDLVAWWRLGDGNTENAGLGVPTTTIEDVSGNGHNALAVVAGDITGFYWGGQTESEILPGIRECLILFSSSSITIGESAGLQFYVSAATAGTMIQTAGFRGQIYRMYLTCTGDENVDTRIFVHGIARPIPGATLRTHAFRRIARLQDLASVQKDTPSSTFPFEYRTSTAELVAASQSDLDKAWIEVQRQCVVLSLDMQTFGVPVNVSGDIQYVSGSNVSVFFGSGSFPALPAVIPAESSSIIAEEQSSSYAGEADVVPTSSSAIEEVVGLSSSSAYVDPYAFQITIDLFNDDDAVTIKDVGGSKTLYSELPFIRFGRDVSSTTTWDSLVRFKIPIDRFAEITLASIVFSARTAESGTTVVLRVNAAYENASLDPVVTLNTTSDPGYVESSFIWDRLPVITAAGQQYQLDVREMLQAFVDRASHTLDDYFTVWIEEVTSDPGARRDADGNTGGLFPQLLVSYRTDRTASSSTV